MHKKNSFFCILGIVAFLLVWRVSFWGERAQSGNELLADVPINVEEGNECVSFLSNYDEALEIAREQNKPVMLFFMAKNCRYSKLMREHAFLDPDVEKISRSFVCLEVDVNDPRYERLCETFGVDATPTVQFVTSYGVPLQRVTKLQTGSELYGQMQVALTSLAWRTAMSPEEPGAFQR